LAIDPECESMISVYNIKPKFQQLLKPVLEFLHKLGVSANMITWSAILLSAGTGALFFFHPYGKIFLLVPAVLLFRMALNALDGMMARTYNMQSKAGEVLNELGDVVSDLALYFPFILIPVNLYVVLSFLFLSLINEFAGVMGKIISGERRYDGPMGKSDRAFAIGAFCLLYYFWEGSHAYASWFFFALNILLIISTLTRIYKALRK
jgi:CDP-diacylglycerol---glycerol-3-phosphate 3-phosphatidyltransferase